MIEENHSEEGSAILEFVALGTMLFIPTIYFLLTIFAVQSASLAASNASQQGIMVVRNQGEQRNVTIQNVIAAANIAAEDFKIDPSNIQVEAHCLDTECNRVKVRSTVQVDLPLVPWVAPQGIGRMTSEATWWGGKYR